MEQGVRPRRGTAPPPRRRPEAEPEIRSCARRRRAKLRTHPGLDEEPAHVRCRLDGEHLGQNPTQRFPDLARPAFARGPSRERGRSFVPAGRPPRRPTAPGPSEVQSNLRIVRSPVTSRLETRGRFRGPSEAKQDETMVEPVVGGLVIEGKGTVVRTIRALQVAHTLEDRPEIRMEHRSFGPDGDRPLETRAGLREPSRLEGSHRVQVPGVRVARLALQHPPARPIRRGPHHRHEGAPRSGRRWGTRPGGSCRDAFRPRPIRARTATTPQRAAPYLRRAAPRTRSGSCTRACSSRESPPARRCRTPPAARAPPRSVFFRDPGGSRPAPARTRRRCARLRVRAKGARRAREAFTVSRETPARMAMTACAANS